MQLVMLGLVFQTELGIRHDVVGTRGALSALYRGDPSRRFAAPAQLGYKFLPSLKPNAGTAGKTKSVSISLRPYGPSFV